MKRLILMRHAKSDWSGPARRDHDRPLAPRGQRAAPRIGRWLAENGWSPDQALVSSARRTQETWQRMTALHRTCPAPAVLPALYGAAARDILRLVQAHGRGATLLVLGHNPGIAEAAALLARHPPADGDFARYPTAATTVLEFPVADWRALAPRSGGVAGFVVPRALG